MDDEKVIDPRYIEMLRKYAANGHKDNDDAMAHAMAGMAYVKPEIPHVEIPRDQDIFKPTKSMLDILSEQIDEKIKQRKCLSCHEGPKQVCGFEKFGDEFYIARIMPDGSMKKEKAEFCPKCGRKLEA